MINRNLTELGYLLELLILRHVKKSFLGVDGDLVVDLIIRKINIIVINNVFNGIFIKNLIEDVGVVFLKSGG